MIPRVTIFKVFLWVVWAMVCTAVIGYLNFPSDKAEAFLLQRVEQAFPGKECVLGPLSYSFPAGFEFRHILVSRKEDGSPLLMLENVLMKPTLKGVGRRFTFRASMHGGTVQGILRVFPSSEEFELNGVEIVGVECGSLEPLQKSLNRQFSGTLTVSGDYKGSWKKNGGAQGSGRFQLENGTTVLRQPILTMKELQISRLESEFRYRAKTIKLTEGRIITDGFSAGFDGDVQTTAKLPAWRLELTGTLVLDEKFLKSKPRVQRLVRRFRQQQDGDIPYYLKGSAGNPRFAFGSG